MCSAGPSGETGGKSASVGVDVLEHFTRPSASASLCCFFCDKPETDGSVKLHQATTIELDVRVHSCALTLQDSTLIAKLCFVSVKLFCFSFVSACLHVKQNAETKQK